MVVKHSGLKSVTIRAQNNGQRSIHQWQAELHHDSRFIGFTIIRIVTCRTTSQYTHDSILLQHDLCKYIVCSLQRIQYKWHLWNHPLL